MVLPRQHRVGDFVEDLRDLAAWFWLTQKMMVLPISPLTGSSRASRGRSCRRSGWSAGEKKRFSKSLCLKTVSRPSRPPPLSRSLDRKTLFGEELGGDRPCAHPPRWD